MYSTKFHETLVNVKTGEQIQKVTRPNNGLGIPTCYYDMNNKSIFPKDVSMYKTVRTNVTRTFIGF